MDLRKSLALRASVVSILAACAAPAVATPITLNFTGTVTQVQFDPFDPLGGAVAPGSGLYTYLNFDTEVADAAASPNVGSYTVSGGTYGMAALVGAVLFPVMSSVNVSIVDGAGGGPDQYSLFAWQGTAGGLGDYFTMSLLLQDDSGVAFDSDALPAGLPDIGGFAIRSFSLTGQYTDINGEFVQYEVLGDILPAAVPMPEPMSASLVAVALLAGGLASRQGRRPAQPQTQGDPS
jgi:hypothetical protein